MCPYELALKLHELGVNSESEFYFVKEMKGGGTQIESVMQNTMRYSYRKEGDLIPAYMSHELGLTKEDIINVIRLDIKQCVERCMRNTYGDDNNLERWIKVMVENELQNRDFNIVSRMVEKVLRDKMLDNIEIIVRNKDIND